MKACDFYPHGIGFAFSNLGGKAFLKVYGLNEVLTTRLCWRLWNAVRRLANESL